MTLNLSAESNNELPSLEMVMINANIHYIPNNYAAKRSLIQMYKMPRPTTETPKEVYCKHCQKQFKNIHAKKKHELSVHGPKLPCEYCGKKLKVFGRQDLMKQHLERCKEYKKTLETNLINNEK